MTAAVQPEAGVSAQFGVHSEVGKLRRVIIHRPDLELKRLTPNNHDELLFDDVLWVRRAGEQHDAFGDLLRGRGVEVLYLETLLAEALAEADGRQWVLDRAVTSFTPTCTSTSRASASGPTRSACCRRRTGCSRSTRTPVGVGTVSST